MKHILNEMSEEEKNSIRSQHTGSLQVQTERFKKLVENKLGNAKPLISEDEDKPNNKSKFRRHVEKHWKSHYPDSSDNDMNDFIDNLDDSPEIHSHFSKFSDEELGLDKPNNKSKFRRHVEKHWKSHYPDSSDNDMNDFIDNLDDASQIHHHFDKFSDEELGLDEDFDNIDYGRTKNGLGPVDDYDFDNIDYGRTKNGLGPDNEELEEDMIDDEDFDDEDEDFDDEDFDDEDFDDEDSSYNSIENMINDALSNLSSEEGEELLERISELVEGLKSNDEDEEDDEDDEDDEDEDEDDESYLNEDYDSDAILNPKSIKYSENPNVDDFLESVFPRLNTEETMNAFRKLLRNDELWEKFSRLMRMFGYNSYHNKEEIFDKVIEWANERGNDEEIW